MVIALGALVVVGAGVALLDRSPRLRADAGAGGRAAQAQRFTERGVRGDRRLDAGARRGARLGACGVEDERPTRSASHIKGAMREGGAATSRTLSARLDVAERRQRSLVSAGSVDYESIAAKDGPAIVFIAVEEAGGETVERIGIQRLAVGAGRHEPPRRAGRAGPRGQAREGDLRQHGRRVEVGARGEGQPHG